MTEQEILAVYEQAGGLLRGHFLLSSGLHSDVYLQSAKVLERPDRSEMLCRELAKPFSGDRVEIVIAPALGGILVAYEVARALGARALFSEREGGTMGLRRGFQIRRGQRCLVVEDVITTGGSTREVIRVVEEASGVLVGVGALIDRSGGAATFPVKKAALATLAIPTYKPEDCPLCKTGSTPIKPGSRT